MAERVIPQPGMIGLTQISGNTGKAIAVGQWLNGEGFREWQHAFVYLPDNQILEAEPGGAVIRPLSYSNIYWCEGLYNLLPTLGRQPGLQKLAASQLQGIPYSFADYAALAARRLHIPAPHLKQFIQDSGHQICSQLADDFYLRLGAHVFDDGRWPGYVTPASLFNRDVQLQAG